MYIWELFVLQEVYALCKEMVEALWCGGDKLVDRQVSLLTANERRVAATLMVFDVANDKATMQTGWMLMSQAIFTHSASNVRLIVLCNRPMLVTSQQKCSTLSRASHVKGIFVLLWIHFTYGGNWKKVKQKHNLMNSTNLSNIPHILATDRSNDCVKRASNSKYKYLSTCRSMRVCIFIW